MEGERKISMNLKCKINGKEYPLAQGATFNEDCDLIAKFTINKYTYKFIVDGKVIKEEVAEYGTEIEFPKTPTKTQDKENKYVFEKWDNESSYFIGLLW